jgi:hypothetical protein
MPSPVTCHLFNLRKMISSTRTYFRPNHIFKITLCVLEGRFASSLPPSSPDPLAAVGPPLERGVTLSRDPVLARPRRSFPLYLRSY